MDSSRKIAKYESMGSLQSLGLPPATNAGPSAPVLGESASKESLDYPLYQKQSIPKMKKPNIHLQKESYFVKVLEAKVRFDP